MQKNSMRQRIHICRILNFKKAGEPTKAYNETLQSGQEKYILLQSEGFVHFIAFSGNFQKGNPKA